MDREALEALKQTNNTRLRSLHAHTAYCGRCRDEVMAFLLSPTRCPSRERKIKEYREYDERVQAEEREIAEHETESGRRGAEHARLHPTTKEART